MKRLIPALMAVAAMFSCSKMEVVETDITLDNQSSGNFTLIGRTYDDEDSKIYIGGLNGDTWPLLWETGDQLKARTASASNVGIATLTKGAGQIYGSFDFSVQTAPSEGTSVRLVYPTGAWSSFTTNTLATNQTQPGGLDCKCDLSKYSFAVADLKYTASGFPTDFKLKHVLSYVCLKVSSKEADFGGLTLSSAKISCSGAALTGTYGTNYNTLEVTPKTTQSYVNVKFDIPVIITDSPKYIWFAVIPCDLTGKTVTVSLTGTFKGRDVVIPIDVDGKVLEAGCANLLDLKDISNENVSKWYISGDARLMAGAGYAFGPANTFLIQCKDGATYAGATYKPVSEYSNKVTFDYKARGDISKVSDPKNYKFGWAAKNYKTTTTKSSYYTARLTNFTTSNIDPTGFSFTVDRDNYTVTVTNESAHAGSPILLMTDANNNIVWGWTFWNIAADGTKLEAVAIDGLNIDVAIANMDIGQPTTDYAKFAANGTSTNRDQVARFINKYQWGRYLPTFWNSYASPNWDGELSGNIPCIKGPVSLEESLKHPYGLVTASSAGSSINDWLSTPDGNLWGNLSSSYTTMGTKTNYDPCPKGWRVPPYYIIYRWKVEANKGSITYISTAGQVGAITNGVYFAASGSFSNTLTNTPMIQTKGVLANGTGNAGYWWSTQNYNDSGTPGYWNFNANSTTSNPGVIFPGNATYAQDYYHSDSANGYRANAFAIRCTPDQYNR